MTRIPIETITAGQRFYASGPYRPFAYEALHDATVIGGYAHVRACAVPEGFLQDFGSRLDSPYGPDLYDEPTAPPVARLDLPTTRIDPSLFLSTGSLD